MKDFWFAMIVYFAVITAACFAGWYLAPLLFMVH